MTACNNTVRLTPGSSFMLAAFFALCLTILSALPLISAVAEQRELQELSTAVSNYYNAEYTAAHIAESIVNGEMPEAVSYESGRYCYSVQIDDSRVLSVELVRGSEGFRVICWRIEFTGSWEPDSSLEIWEGYS